MALTAADKAWIARRIEKSIRGFLDEFLAAQIEQVGAYDGATEVVDDDWADEGKKAPRRKIGFSTPTTGANKKMLK